MIMLHTKQSLYYQERIFLNYKASYSLSAAVQNTHLHVYIVDWHLRKHSVHSRIDLIPELKKARETRAETSFLVKLHGEMDMSKEGNKQYRD